MRWFLQVALVVCLLSVASVGFAVGELGVSVAEEGEDVVIEVADDGEPAVGANVSVSGVDGETAIDGEYTTDSGGRVVFTAEETANLTGVVYLRITVDYEDSGRSTLTSLTRGADFDEAGFGQRLSRTLSVSAAETQGEVESTLKVEEAGGPIGATHRAELLSNHVNDRLVSLGEARFELQVIGNKRATGDISDRDYYVQTIYRSSEIAYLERDIPKTARALNQVDSDALEREGVDNESLAELVEEVESDEEIDGDRRIR